VSRSQFLRHHDQYKSVFIAPDRVEQDKHKRTVEDLKRRHTNGKTGLIIRNGVKQPSSTRSSVDQNSSRLMLN